MERSTSVTRNRDRRFSVPRLISSLVIGAACSIPEEPSARRTAAIIDFVSQEPFLSGAMYAHCSRLANARYRLIGSRDSVNRATAFLGALEFGRGWKYFLMSLFWSVLVSDQGGWFEKVRDTFVSVGGKRMPVWRTVDGDGKPVWVTEAGTVVDPSDVMVDTESEIRTLAVIDPTRITVTGDPEYPIAFEDYDGSVRLLHASSVGAVVDAPVPGKPYGTCAVSRILEAVRLMVAVLGWHLERVSGNMARTVVLSNVPPSFVARALDEAAKSSFVSGNRRYVPPVFVSPLDPSAEPSAKVIHLADLPEGFNFQDFFQLYVTIVANGLGADYAAFAPLPGSRLGTATEAEVMERLATTRSYGLLLGMLEHELNSDVMTQFGVQIRFVAADYTEEQQAAQAALLRARVRAVRISSGEITPEVARQLATDDGDLPAQYLKVFYGERNILDEDIDDHEGET